jgi:hypothetical protein
MFVVHRFASRRYFTSQVMPERNSLAFLLFGLRSKQASQVVKTHRRVDCRADTAFVKSIMTPQAVGTVRGLHHTS